MKQYTVRNHSTSVWQYPALLKDYSYIDGEETSEFLHYHGLLINKYFSKMSSTSSSCASISSNPTASRPLARVVGNSRIK